VIMNAGTPKGVIGDALSSVEIMNDDGSITTLDRNQLHLGYRSSGLEGKWVVFATLSLNPAPQMEIEQRIKKELLRREETQPVGTKNAGSVFRNPENNFAGKLIEAVGLKGKEFGRVMFSRKHANFIENLGGAKAHEVRDLMYLAQKMVKEKFNIDLIPEVKIIPVNGKSN
jgi:UDP-N-acetylmuramate dehydrogenase